MERTTRIALAGLVLGILGLVGLAPLTSIPAIVCAHMARDRIRHGEGKIRGRRMATAAAALGYIGIALTIATVPFIIAGPVISPGSLPEETLPVTDRCRKNLLLIAFAKEEATYDMGLSEGDTVTAEQLRPYMRDGFEDLRCPEGGAYIINPVGRGPECSVEGHELDF
jgi:hypothetical protein